MTVSYTPPFNLQNGTIADATQVMANFNAITASFATAASAGANNDITSLLGLTTPIPAANGGSTDYYGGTAGGSANAKTVTAAPAGFTMTAGRRIRFIGNTTNTAAATLNVSATGVTAIEKISPAGKIPLSGGELVSGQMIDVIYDGSVYVLMSSATMDGGFGNATSIASAATTQLGNATSHFASITGGTTITSFGSTGASIVEPFYAIKFTGALTLTHNAVSLILPGGQNITTAANDTAIALYLGGTNWQIIAYMRASGAPIVPIVTPDFQTFLTGTGLTYTTPTANGVLPRYLRVRMVGGGGGGGGSGAGAAAGGNGTATVFGLWTADFGNGGGASTAQTGGVGGSGGTDSTGTVLRRIAGQAGNGDGAAGPSGQGGGTPFMPGGTGWAAGTHAGSAVPANTGAGGGGGMTTATAGAGGGGGEFVEFIITSVAASYTRTVGAGGSAGAGTNGGAAGAAGRIEVEAYWQ